MTVLSAPIGLTCTVSAGDGVIGSASVTNVAVTCSVNAFNVGGGVTGIVDGSLTLELNGDEEIVLTTDGTFAFPTPVADGSPYEVTIVSPPTHTNCTITNATGTVAGADVTDVQVSCTRSYTIGGRVFGATAGLGIRLNGAEEILVSAGTVSPFTFATRLASGAAYTVTVSIPPAGQSCRVEDGTGTVPGAGVTGIEIYCTGPASGLYAADSATASIYRKINVLNGTTQALTGNIDFDLVGGLAYNESGSLLYGLDSATSTLLAINTTTGAPATIGSTGSVGVADVNGLAYDDSSGVLYGIASASGSSAGQLITIDTATGVGTNVGTGFATGGGQCLGLAVDDTNDVLYASTDDGFVVTVDPATGGATGTLTVGMAVSIDGLGFEQSTGTLYGVFDGQTVVTIDTDTGGPTTSGTVDGFPLIGGLAYAGDFDDLFGTDTGLTGASVLLSIDPADAAARTVGSMGWPLTGMGQDPANGVAYGITADSHLLLIDQDTGETRYIAQVAIPGGQETRCLAYNLDTGSLFTFGVNPAGDDELLEVGTDGTLVTNHGTVIALGGDWEALCFAISGSDRRMFGIHDPVGNMDVSLYEVGPTGTVTLQYALSALVEVKALAYLHDSGPGRFFGLDTSNDRLIQIDRVGGNITVIGLTQKGFGLIWIP